jgi:hypothetical protein
MLALPYREVSEVERARKRKAEAEVEGDATTAQGDENNEEPQKPSGEACLGEMGPYFRPMSGREERARTQALGSGRRVIGGLVWEGVRDNVFCKRSCAFRAHGPLRGTYAL